MVEKKSIKIDPTLFTFSDPKTNKTRKKEKPKGGRIPKIKTQDQKKKDTLKKQSLLKMIRHHQEDKYKQLFEKKNKKKEMEYEEEKKKYIDSFESSKEYLENLIETKKNKEHVDKPKNTTIKDRTNLLTSGNKKNEDIPKFTLDLSTLTGGTDATSPIITMEPNIELSSLNEFKNENILEEPKYGVLKGGKLPTYRNYFNKTQKEGSIFDKLTIPEMESRNKEIRDKMSKKNNYAPIYKKNKHKKIKRRTFNAGKSRKIPKIGVLVSNKTIRNNTNLKIMKVKEVPISKIKKELVRRGLIKIGTITPNDVLRKMYETVELMCGDVQNHNPDNLLHNFINDKY